MKGDTAHFATAEVAKPNVIWQVLWQQKPHLIDTLPVKWERNKSSFSAQMSSPLFCSISHIIMLPHPLFSRWHLPRGMVSFNTTISHLLLQEPQGPVLSPPTALLEMLTLTPAILVPRNLDDEGCLSLLGGILSTEWGQAHPSSSPGLWQKASPATSQRATGRVHLLCATSVTASACKENVCSALHSWWWDSGNFRGLLWDRQESVL